MSTQLRKDALAAIGKSDATRAQLAKQRIAITGGTGFLGCWIAEIVAALNDEFKLGIVLDLYARNPDRWVKAYPHLSSRKDITAHVQDVRSSFEFPGDTNFVIHAAGIPDNRVHASDPLRVFDTTVYGTHCTLEAATKLARLRRFIHVSSGLVTGINAEPGKTHLVYIDAKRAAESLCAIYRSQHRLPISTVRPYTFIGPYQELDRPWAVNNFLRDALSGSEIRLHGDGLTQRSYLYGADAAWWTLSALVHGADGKAYALGSGEPITHRALAELVAHKVSPAPSIILRTLPGQQLHYDFLPDIKPTLADMKVAQSCALDPAIDHTLQWHRANAGKVSHG